MSHSEYHETFAGIRMGRRMVDSGAEEFSGRAALEGHIGMAAFVALARDPKRVVVIDHTRERREMNAGTMLAVAVALSRRWRRTLTGRRVGVALPPGIGGFLANLALVFAGKIPVNLNFTIGRVAAEGCLRRGGVTEVVSAAALQEKIPDFPWPKNTLDLTAEIAACGKPRIVAWLLAIRLLPVRWLARRLGVPERGGDVEAALLFTSGSVGEPKGVVLSHRNILGNIRQIRETCLMRPGQPMLGCLPYFHSFGFTVTLWYPVIQNLPMATFPSPLETRRLAEVIQAEQVKILVGAPTFLRPFLKRAEPAQLRSLALVVTGAEKLPPELHEQFRQVFGVSIREGYGLTETSPVLAVNRPERIPLAAGGDADGNRPGSVGLLVAGMQARIVDPGTREPLDPREVGVLAVRGCNVFNGYLDDTTATNAVLHDGWFHTGDLARFDDDGFLYIEGRLSRFSKIAGEMVPHGTVEQKIIEVFGWSGAEAQPVVVVAVSDEVKGEALVVLAAEDITVEDLRGRLSAAGLPNLWIPKRVLRVKRVPTLSTGKLDLRTCRQMAAELENNPSGT